ncbi:hypothetical protein DFP72DRAFT_847263 [Ephemerocybe angulata]|uniref:Homeobox domain-containing protein n=1 Tax=Ephemerocybe angulata TaxID=980116 RepID=A0A8H6M782_9AGAR|nr:hypothetical protein DFP72DRAFT_847263 [Tulosesus angulatus]
MWEVRGREEESRFGRECLHTGSGVGRAICTSRTALGGTTDKAVDPGWNMEITGHVGTTATLDLMEHLVHVPSVNGMPQSVPGISRRNTPGMHLAWTIPGTTIVQTTAKVLNFPKYETAPHKLFFVLASSQNESRITQTSPNHGQPVVRTEARSSGDGNASLFVSCLQIWTSVAALSPSIHHVQTESETGRNRGAPGRPVRVVLLKKDVGGKIYLGYTSLSQDIRRGNIPGTYPPLTPSILNAPTTYTSSAQNRPDFCVAYGSPKETPSSNIKPKRTKVNLTKDQADALRIVFEHTPEPTREERKDLARDLGLTFEKVSRWFSRERSDAPRRLLPDGTKPNGARRLTKEQTSRLEQEYARNKQPSERRQKEIALDLGLSELTVSNWYI